MHTMVDELYDRAYRAGRTELNTAISTFVQTLWQAIANPFRVLHRIEYSAPWAVTRPRCK